MITWERLDELARARDLDGIGALLLAAAEDERLAAAKQVEAGIRAADPDLWWRADKNPAAGWALAVIGCMPTAARAAALLGRRGMQMWNRMWPDRFLRIARARELPWIGDLGVRLAERLPARDVWYEDWRFTAALIQEGSAEPPATEGFVRGWLDQLLRSGNQAKRLPPLHERMRDDPFLDTLLPAVFTIDGLGADAGVGHLDPRTAEWDATPRFPAVVAALAAEGRLDRATVLNATVDRLVRGDRPNALRPFVLLHEALAPTVAELAGHAAGYARLLPSAPPAIAGMAQRALRTVDEAGRLELETFLEVSAGTLLRTEKTLVKAQLTWLSRKVPERPAEVCETIATAFGHPALDIQERALTLIGRHADRLDPAVTARLADAAATLGGDLPDRAAELFGGVPAPAPAVPGLPPPAPVAEMPPPIADVAELLEETVLLMTEETAVRWERVMAGFVALRPGAGFAPLLRRFEHAFSETIWVPQQRTTFLGEAIRALGGDSDRTAHWSRMVSAVEIAWATGRRGGPDSALRASPEGMLAARVAEMAVQVARVPVPRLVATPTHVNGSLDAAVLAARLARAEAEGWEPWPLDLEQAILRVPRSSDPAVAAGLTSPAGKLFADYLAGGGLPDPVSTRVEQRADATSIGPVWGTPVVQRVLAGLEPAGTGGLRITEQLVTLDRRPAPQRLDRDFVAETDMLTMVLPHHREVSAAWALVRLAGLADQDYRTGGELLPLLAECDGPFGPAMTLALAYVLAARHEADRVAGVDAFLTFAVKQTPAAGGGAFAATDGASFGASFAAAVGAELGRLCGADSPIKLTRVVPALTDAHRAGASAAVWELLAAALPLVAPKGPRGLPDLLELAAQVARAVQARGEIGEVAALAERGGGSRLVKEARRLHTVLTS